MTRAQFLVVSDDVGVLEGLVADLDRRFGRDYAVTGAPAARAAEVMERLAADSHVLALLIIDERLADPSALELFARGRKWHPTAKRVLLIQRGNWSSAHPMVAAMALGQVDYHLYNPWFPIERLLYPAISEFLASWTRARDAPAVPVRIVGQAVIIATGVSCHRLEALVGAGVFNGTGAAEARRSAGNTSSSRPLTRPPGGATPRPVRLLCHHAGPRCCARRQDGRSPCDRHPPARPPSAFSWAPK